MLKPSLLLNTKDIKEMNKRLRAMEGDLLKEMRKEIKQIAKPVMQKMKQNIPSQAPMSGMKAVVRYRDGSYAINEGRLRYDGKGLNPAAGKSRKKYPPNTVHLSQASKATGRSLTTPLVKLSMKSAAASMVDMAGRVGRTRPVSREYTIRLRNGELQKRRHRVTTQGQQFMSNIQGQASRYAWPALTSQLGAVKSQIDKVVAKYYRIANRGF